MKRVHLGQSKCKIPFIKTSHGAIRN
jgi:hypothetical protein